MTEYMDEYESIQNEIDSVDKSLLKQITTNTLFCRGCYKPFTNQQKNIENELAIPFDALLDFCSGITFVCIPIAWFPLVVLFAIFAFKDWITDKFQDESKNQNYTNQNFDAEYFEKKKKKRKRQHMHNL
eukprot:60673_1